MTNARLGVEIHYWKSEDSHTAHVPRACACRSPLNEFATFSSTIAIVFVITMFAMVFAHIAHLLVTKP